MQFFVYYNSVLIPLRVIVTDTTTTTTTTTNTTNATTNKK